MVAAKFVNVLASEKISIRRSHFHEHKYFAEFQEELQILPKSICKNNAIFTVKGNTSKSIISKY